MTKILVLHGPNLNLLGTREPKLYGSMGLDAINKKMSDDAAQIGFELVARQSNAEHELIEWVQTAPQQQIDLIIINPGAFTHTSIALRDALLAVAVPFIEVHLSNVHAREAFRRHSYFSDIALGTLTGFGPNSYHLALQAAYHYLKINK